MEKLGVERALHSYTRPLEPTQVNQIQCNFWILRVKQNGCDMHVKLLKKKHT